MGLKQYIQAKADLRREVITVTTGANGSGSINLGSAYLLYFLESDTDCRVRLYDNESSLNDATEQSRGFGNTNIPASIALISDFNLTSGSYTIDPGLYGVTATPSNKLTYYRINNAATPPVLRLGRYLLEDSAISAASRTVIPVIETSLSPGQMKSGSIASVSMPKTYLLVSASVNNTSAPIRVRMYNLSSALSNTVEKNRPYTTESETRTLIVDAILTGSETTYFVPKIVGANLENMGTDLSIIKSNFSTLAGKSEMYYIIENLATAGSTEFVTASFHAFSLED